MRRTYTQVQLLASCIMFIVLTEQACCDHCVAHVMFDYFRMFDFSVIARDLIGCSVIE